MRLTVPKMSERVCASRNSGTLRADFEGPTEVAWQLTPFSTGEIREAISGARKEIDDLKQILTSPEHKKIFERVKQSRQHDPKGIKPWDAKDEPDWYVASV